MDYQANQYTYNPEGATQVNTDAKVATFMRNVYVWMGIGLLLTSAVAFFAGTSKGFWTLMLRTDMMVYYAIFIVWAIMGFVMSLFIGKMSKTVSAIMFLIYSVLTGLALADIFLIYSSVSILTTFGIAGGMFLGMSLYGTITKRDLTKVGQLAVAGLMGILIAMLVNFIVGPLLWRTSINIIDIVISFIGVIVFLGLIAYRTQQLREIAIYGIEGQEGNLAIYGAYTLYVSFINLFLFLLRILGRRR